MRGRLGYLGGVRLCGVAFVGGLAFLAGCDGGGRAPAPAGSTSRPFVLPPRPEERPSDASYAVPWAEALDRRPDVVLVEVGGQTTELVAAAPLFALFDDGLVLARRGGRGRVASWDAEAAEALRQEVAASGVLGLAPKHRGGMLTSHTISTALLVRRGERYKAVVVDHLHRGESTAPETPPPVFMALYQKLTALPLGVTKPWEPEYAFVALRRDGELGEPWPRALPEPTAARFDVTDGQFFFYVVDRAHLPFAQGLHGLLAFEGGGYRVLAAGPTYGAAAFVRKVIACATSAPPSPAACR